MGPLALGRINCCKERLVKMRFVRALLTAKIVMCPESLRRMKGGKRKISKVRLGAAAAVRQRQRQTASATTAPRLLPQGR